MVTETPIQMRFADVDMLGHVNNVNQQHYFDLGKNEFFAEVLDMKPYWKAEGLIIVATNSTYASQIRMDEPIAVRTRITKIGHKSFTLHQQIVNTQNGQLKTECTTVLVAFNFELQHSVELPSLWRDLLSNAME